MKVIKSVLFVGYVMMMASSYGSVTTNKLMNLNANSYVVTGVDLSTITTYDAPMLTSGILTVSGRDCATKIADATNALAEVAHSGKYSDLSGTPTLAAVATSGAYADLSGTPTLAAIATSGNYSDLNGKPELAPVATSGSYNDLANKPTIPAAQIQSDWTQADTTALDYIKNKPTLANVATSGSYNDLADKPTIPAAQVQANWDEVVTSSKAYIRNKPIIPAAQVQTDWNATSGMGVLLNKPSVEYILIDSASNLIQPSSGQIVKRTISAGSLSVFVPLEDGGSEAADFVIRINATVATQIGAISDSQGNTITIDWIGDDLTVTGSIAANKVRYITFTRVASLHYLVMSQEAN